MVKKAGSAFLCFIKKYVQVLRVTQSVERKMNCSNLQITGLNVVVSRSQIRGPLSENKCMQSANLNFFPSLPFHGGCGVLGSKRPDAESL